MFSPSMMSHRIDTQRVYDNYSQYMPNNRLNSPSTMSKQYYVSQPGNYATQSRLHPWGFSVFPPHLTSFVNNLMTKTQGYQFLLEEAREIRYAGRGISFIFFDNQIIKLWKRCGDANRKMVLLCLVKSKFGRLCPRFPGWDVNDLIQRALEGLRLRYGCSSFISEPVVKNAQSGPKFKKMDVLAQEQLISKLNDCELYARAHEQVGSINRVFILDVVVMLTFFGSLWQSRRSIL